jgi:hypothetical protein
MSVESITAEVKPATLDAARAIMVALEAIAEPHGWTAALYGSTLFGGRGRDIDLLLAPTKHGAVDDSVIVHELRVHTQLEMLLQTGNVLARGIVGRWYGYAVDLTIIRKAPL